MLSASLSKESNNFLWQVCVFIKVYHKNAEEKTYFCHKALVK